jgi:DNA-binding response OmpR family regulator
MRAAGTVVPAVFMTASDDAALDGATRRLNVRLLRKPFAIDDLVSAVGAAIAGTREGI